MKNRNIFPDDEPANKWENLIYNPKESYSYLADQYGRVSIPTFNQVFPGRLLWDKVPDSVLKDKYKGKGATYQDVYENYTDALRRYNKEQTIKHFPEALSRQVNQDRRNRGLRTLGDTGELNVFAYPLIGAMALPAASAASTSGLLPAAAHWAGTTAVPWTAKNILLPGLAGAVWNEMSKLTTGNEWSTNVANGLDYLGVPQDIGTAAGDLLNPGYIIPLGRIANSAFKRAGIMNSLVHTNKSAQAFSKTGLSGPVPAAALKAKSSAPFKSELDWRPESWFATRPKGIGYDAQDVAALESHVPEYLEIERTAKANGTWLKMEDGSYWEGDPRSWVQLKSRNGQALSQERLYTGMDSRRAQNPEYTGDVWADRQRKVSSYWAGEETKHPGTVLEVTPVKSTRYITDAQGGYWWNIPRKQNNSTFHEPATESNLLSTNNIVDFAKSKGHQTTQINNVIEGSNDLVDDVIIHEGTPRKSLLGNNGDFDLANPNYYKGLIPFVAGSGLYNFSNE